jgi:hypothetical protein
MIGDPVIIAQTMTARGIMTALLATDGSRCGAGAAVLCPRYGSITGSDTGIATAAILNFLRRSHEQKEAYHDQDH